MAKKEIKVCKYAGDPEDDFCKSCDGLKVKDEVANELYPADQCAGYAVEEELEEPIVEEVKTPEPAPVIDTKLLKTAKLLTDPKSTAGSQHSAPLAVTYTPKAVTTTIRAESGLTVELMDKRQQKSWYKFNYTEERIVMEGVDMEKEKEALWTDVNATVDKQVEDIINFLNVN